MGKRAIGIERKPTRTTDSHQLEGNRTAEARAAVEAVIDKLIEHDPPLLAVIDRCQSVLN